MEVKSTTKFVRLSPQKARDVAREIQGLAVSTALDILTFTPKKAAQLIGKTSCGLGCTLDHDIAADLVLVVAQPVGELG